jgi:hypothetical protein
VFADFLLAKHQVARHLVTEFVETALVDFAGQLPVEFHHGVRHHAFKDKEHALVRPAVRHGESMAILAYFAGRVVAVFVSAKAFGIPARRHGKIRPEP